LIQRILSWNILQGGGRRTGQIIEAIAGFKCDLVCLQEFRPGKQGERIRQALSDQGLTEQYVAPLPDGVRNSLLVAATTPISAAQVFPADWVGNPHVARVRLNALGPLEIFAVHFPQKKAQVPLFDALLDLDRQIHRDQTLIVGDINCGIPFEDSETRTFVNTHMFSALLAQGWVDVWRSRNADAREFTWRSSRGANGFRYDHALATDPLNRRIRFVQYKHEVRRARISDHSAMIIELQADQ